MYNLCINLLILRLFMDQKAISSDLIRGHIDTIILYSLFENDKYAQQISDYIEEKSNGDYKINQATLYSSLKRLETLKHVSTYWYDANESGRRKFFHLTDSGKELVENNLSSWSYSKNIIDRLMDCEPSERTVEVQKEKIVYVVKEPEITPVAPIQTLPQAQETHSINAQPIVEKEIKIVNENKQEIDKIEINFRAILNSLIKTKPKQKSNDNLLEKENDIAQIEEKQQEKPLEDVKKFNETLTESSYNEETTSFNGKIDFGDLKIKASQDGYKLRVSSKESAIPDGSLKLNKLNFVTSIILLLIASTQFIPMYFINSSILAVSSLEIILFSLIICAYPFYTLVHYISAPNTSKAKRYYSDGILTCSIIVFNLLLICVAITFLANMDFGIKSNVIKYVYAPVMVIIDALIFTCIRYGLSKLNSFYKNK